MHAALGAVGVLSAAWIGQYNAVMGAIAATATAGYMCLRAAREWVKLRRDRKTDDTQPKAKNDDDKTTLD